MVTIFSAGMTCLWAEPDDFSSSGASNKAESKTASPQDPYLWLEEVEAERALDWAKEQNQITQRELEQHPEFDKIRQRLLSVLDSKEKIPYVSKRGDHLYNFWRDDKHVRGLWRRTTMEEYRKDHPNWEIVLDLDRLAAEEDENWVWHGADVLYPDRDRALVFLSRGGADADVTREFDLEKKAFVEDGFFLPEAKSRVEWRDRDTLYVATDFGDGTLTESGYPRLVKEWRRGAPLEEAETIFAGETEDVAVSADVTHHGGHKYETLRRAITFYTSEQFVRRGKDGRWQKVEKPKDAGVRFFRDQILLELRSDWTVKGETYPAGALLSANFNHYMNGDRRLEILFQPSPRKSLDALSMTKNYLLLNELEDVHSQLYALRLENGRWSRTSVSIPPLSSASIWGADPHESDQYFLTVENFLTPATLYVGTGRQEQRLELKRAPAFFDSSGLEVKQAAAASKDGTKAPYFVVAPKNIERNGNHPTLLYGYGGFQISLTPSYDALTGAGWLERGGVYVLANIRGGGEFGPEWHKAAMRENRQRAYDDFIAIAEDLVRKGITSPDHLGIMGGSNGGLLMGVMLTQRPDLFDAIVCAAPLLDMRRYHELLAGASWMGEYGDPDNPEDWAFIKEYSPYQNLQEKANYPRVLFTSSTRDDRVHPGHARKMVAKMKHQGHDALYYENIEGGHGGAANNEQRAYMKALAYTFLWRRLAASEAQ